ncbi:DUF4342 domain-containing protein [Tumidithrix helvetica PCC 7403]|uniref:hypothetical protein n=1 Tax=Tumidithrix helvetica TaxID=3457545 RepID=UPI003C9E2AE9
MFSDEEISKLAAEIDAELLELRSQPNDATLKLEDKRSQLAKQNQAIERATGEPADSFLKKFWRVAKADLCEEGGKLNAQWKKWGDLDNKDLLTTFGLLFPSLGLEGSIAGTVAISVAVIILNIGVKTFCEEYGDRE